VPSRRTLTATAVATAGAAATGFWLSGPGTGPGAEAAAPVAGTVGPAAAAKPKPRSKAVADDGGTAATGATGVDGSTFVSSDPLLHLLRRATYGPTPESIAEIRRLGAQGWLDRQLDPGSIGDGLGESLAGRFPLIDLSTVQVRDLLRAGQVENYDWTISFRVSVAAIARGVWSKRQLFELMADFWANHLNVPTPGGDVWDSRADYDRTVIRKHALGTFADLLKASARHPAMLTYLDNRSSNKRAPNENYGRELLELHTVGLVYGEKDVRNAARLLTGMTVDGDSGGYVYRSAEHATGAVTVLDFKHANASASGGEAAALKLLDHLALHPETARHIATKLCVRFVADLPPMSLIGKLAKVYLDNKSAIRPVLKALFSSPEFAASRGHKLRTPLEDVLGTVRALGLGPEKSGTAALEELYWILKSAGHAPMGWVPPDGYPDIADAWTSPAGQLMRWNAHLNLAAGWWPSGLDRPADLRKALIGPSRPATYGKLIDAVAKRLVGRTLKAAHSRALADFYGKSPASTLHSGDPVLSYTFPHLVAMILNSPYYAVR
jgi:uncharacterized protein (DUF1800 family)